MPTPQAGLLPPGVGTLAIVRQNIGFAFLVTAAFIALTVAGRSSLWLAVLADTGTTVLVVLNSLGLVRAAETPTGSGHAVR